MGMGVVCNGIFRNKAIFEAFCQVHVAVPDPNKLIIGTAFPIRALVFSMIPPLD
jgi:hypothetical protein